MKRLIIARHGNTFTASQTPTRVGAKTDLELVEEERARGIGKYLKQQGIIPDKIFAAPLKRTMQTARLALEELALPLNVTPFDGFTEIDYGVDENKTEERVIDRIGRQTLLDKGITSPSLEEIEKSGKEVIELWNTEAILPTGWQADVPQIIQVWKDFSNAIQEEETILVVSSNGIIRFAPHILSNYKTFYQNNDIKVATGAVCLFENQANQWQCAQWNIKAFKQVI